MNLATLLQTQAHTRPQSPALIETIAARERITCFAELELQVGQAVALLQGYGLKPGDAVLVFYPMSAELYVILGALFRLGLMAMFLDPSAGSAHFDRCCALCPPRAMIASTKAYWLTVRSAALRQIPLKFALGLPLPGTISWHLRSIPANPAILAADAETPALLTFTSGSTGQPKPVLRTQGFLLNQYRVLKDSLHLTPGVTELVSLPLFVLANLATGATSLIPCGNLRKPGSIAPAPIVRQIQTHPPDRLLASPAFLKRLVRDCAAKNLTFPGIQRIVSGGAPILPRLLRQLQSFAPSAEIVVLYGSTEAEPIAHIAHHQIAPQDHRAMQSGRGLLVGQPIPAIQLKILRRSWRDSSSPTGEPQSRSSYMQPDFQQDCLPTNQVGEIVVSGEHVLQGYWQGLGNGETKFHVDGTVWHRTGDAGYLDESGRLWLMGRCQAVIQDEKGTLYPFAIDCLMQQHQQINRSAVLLHQGQRLLLIEPVRPPSSLLTVSLTVNLKVNLNLADLQPFLEHQEIDRVLVLRRIPVDDRHNSKIAYSRIKL